MSPAQWFNLSGFSRFINSPRGRLFRLVAGTGLLIGGFRNRQSPAGLFSMAWSALPLSAAAYDLCYISAALGGPLAGREIRAAQRLAEPGPGAEPDRLSAPELHV